MLSIYVRALSFLFVVVALYLPLGCSSSQPDNHNSTTKIENQALAALKKLQKSSEEKVTVRMDDHGLPTYVSAKLPLRVGLEPDPVEFAILFLEEYRDLYRIEAPRDQLYLQRVVKRGEKYHVFFGQHIDGVPIYGSSLAIHLRNGFLTSTNGRYLAPPLESLDARILSSEAFSVVKKEFIDANARLVSEPQLIYFDPGLVGEKSEGFHLAWRFTVQGAQYNENKFDLAWTFFVDAQTGQILLSFSNQYDHSGGPPKTISVKDASQVSLSVDCSSFDPARNLSLGEDSEGDRAFLYSGRTYDFFHDTFSQHSYDDTGSSIAFVRANLDNAAYIVPCNVLVFGNDYLADDVFAHEFTHGVIRFTSELIYMNESGALNESYADVFGSFLDPDLDWSMGEDLPLGPFRSLSNPQLYNTSSSTGFSHPAHLDDFVVTDEDRGGVHINSGIPNKAAYLMAEGLFGLSIGREKTAQLLFETMTTLPRSARLIDARDRAIEVARGYVNAREHGFDAVDRCSVMEAYSRVGLGMTCAESGIDDDADFIPDENDNCTGIANTFQSDIDGDGTGETVDCDDNCPLVSNGDQKDFNSDGRGDACWDSDGDSIVDIEDNCPGDANRQQENLDSDMQGDVCDSDIDGDGVDESDSRILTDEDREQICTGGQNRDCFDNCLVLSDLDRSYNPEQSDIDGDRVGDSCDNCEGILTSDISDSDGDGEGDFCDLDDDDDSILDVEDNCRVTSNPYQLDIDGNGVTRNREVHRKTWLGAHSF